MGALNALAWTCTALAVAGACAQTLNLREFVELQPAAPSGERVVACIAVRNAARDIVACVESLLAQPDIAAVVVCDDASIDETRAIIADLEARYAPRVVTARAASPGKSAALACAAKRAISLGARRLFFTDADVRLVVGAIGALERYARVAQADAISGWIAMPARTLWDALFSQALMLFVLQCLPLRLVRERTDPRFAAANGQFVFVDAAVYARSGGHVAAGAAIVEDVALARVLKRGGARLAIVSGVLLASTRPYGSLRANIEGYGRSLRHGAGRGGAAVFGMWQLCAFALPWLFTFMHPIAGCTGIAAITTSNVTVARRLRAGSAWFASAVLGGAVVGCAALWSAMRRSFRWHGREC